MSQRWYAIRVKSNREKCVSSSLAGKGFESFLPTYRTRRQWSDRTTDIDVPLFSGYVFCRLDPAKRLPILKTPGVVVFVSFGNEPAALDDREIEAIQSIVKSGIPAAPWPFLTVGQKVRIERGPLRDSEGLLIEIKNQYRLIVSVSLLQRSVAVEVDRDCIRPTKTLWPS